MTRASSAARIARSTIFSMVFELARNAANLIPYAPYGMQRVSAL
jgi:hypothetical protein